MCSLRVVPMVPLTLDFLAMNSTIQTFPLNKIFPLIDTLLDGKNGTVPYDFVICGDQSSY